MRNGRAVLTNGGSIPKVLTLSQVVSEVPESKSKAIVDLAHARLGSASEPDLWDHVGRLFEACVEHGFSPSQALSLVWASWAGWECRMRGLTPADLWEREGRQAFDAVIQVVTVRPTIRPPAQWWGTRFEVWAGDAEPELPISFRRAAGWAVLSALIGGHVSTPTGSARLAVGFAGANARTRADAQRLGGNLGLVVESAALSALSGRPDRLTAAVPDDVNSPEALCERQGPPNYSRDGSLALLVSEALDGLERAQASSVGPLVVVSSEEALDAVTAFKVDLAARLRTSDPDTMDAALTGSTALLRSMAAVVAVLEGATVVSGSHQAIAIDSAHESVESFIRFREIGRWVA